jgi:hypothetical protein
MSITFTIAFPLRSSWHQHHCALPPPPHTASSLARIESLEIRIAVLSVTDGSRNPGEHSTVAGQEQWHRHKSLSFFTWMLLLYFARFRKKLTASPWSKYRTFQARMENSTRVMDTTSSFLAELTFHKDGGTTHLRKICKHIKQYTASHHTI